MTCESKVIRLFLRIQSIHRCVPHVFRVTLSALNKPIGIEIQFVFVLVYPTLFFLLLTAPNTGMVTAICPQLRNQNQCCTDSVFSDGAKMLKGKTIFAGIEQQSQSRIVPFRALSKSIMQCKLFVCSHFLCGRLPFRVRDLGLG